MPRTMLFLFAALLFSAKVLAGDGEPRESLGSQASDLGYNIAEILEFLERIDHLHEEQVSRFHRSRAALGSLSDSDRRSGAFQLFRRGRQARVESLGDLEDSNLSRQQIRDREHRQNIDEHPKRVAELRSNLRQISAFRFRPINLELDAMWSIEPFQIQVHSPFTSEDFKLLLIEIRLGLELLTHAVHLPVRQAGLETQILSYVIEQTINYLQALQASSAYLIFMDPIQKHPLLKMLSKVIGDQMEVFDEQALTNGSLLGLAETLVTDFTQESISRFQRRLIATLIGIPVALNLISFTIIGLTHMSEASTGAVITATQILALALDISVYRLHWVQEARQRHLTQPRRISRALKGIMRDPKKCQDALAYIILSEQFRDK